MCVAIPGPIVSIAEGKGRSRPAVMRVAGRDVAIDLILVPEAGIGDHVVAHSGYAIRVVPAAAQPAGETRSVR
jgi:hydrogenase assembly chaperone HypC/HupF